MKLHSTLLALFTALLVVPFQFTYSTSDADRYGVGVFQSWEERYLSERGLLFYVFRGVRSSGDMDISVDIPSTRVESRRLDSWGGYSIGVKGERITFYSRAVNHGDLPAFNVTASLTVYYWSGIGGIDRGKIIWSEKKSTYVPPGDGSLSPVVVFNWTPEISGAFIINITFELRGDPHPRDNSAYYVGAVYDIGGKRRYAGVWVDYWIDSLEGNSEIVCSPPYSWAKTTFPLPSCSGEYSPPTVFYTGNPSTLVSNHNSTPRKLVLPPFDLREVPQDFYDPLYMKKKPQIYFGYRFLGDVKAGGTLRNLISVDGGPYEPLLDPLGNQVLISVNTSDEYGEYNWLHPTHVDLFGYNFYPGIEISRYAGHWVRIAVEYLPGSPENGTEMGYFLDDFILFMRESCETFSFEVEPRSTQEVRVEPGSATGVVYRVNFTRVKERYPLRIFPETPPIPQIHLTSHPEVLREPVEGEAVEISLYVEADPSASPGRYTVSICFLGAQMVVRRSLVVTVPPLEELSAEGGGVFYASSGETVQIPCTLVNSGNVPLNLKSFLNSDLEIQAEYPEETSLTPGERISLEADVTLKSDIPGNHTVYWVFYPADVRGVENIPPRELYQRLREEGRAAGLIVANLVVREVRDVFVALLSRESLVVLEKTPQNVSIPLSVINKGNVPETLKFSADLKGVEEGGVVSKGRVVLLNPGESTELSITLSLNSSTLHGGYWVEISARENDGGVVVWTGVFRLNVLNEKMVKELYNERDVSVEVIPGELIRGREAMIVVNATPSHPVTVEELKIKLTVFLKGVLYAERSWRCSGRNTTTLRWVLPFRDTGNLTIKLNLTWEVYGRYFWHSLKPIHLTVHNVNVRVLDIFFMDREGRMQESVGRLPPGWYSPAAVITNTGDTIVMGFRVKFTLKTEQGEENKYMNITSLLPGERRIIRVEDLLHYFSENSSVTVRVVMDPDQKLPEGNRDDNTMQRTFYVSRSSERSSTEITKYTYRLLALIIILIIVFISVRAVKRVMWEEG